MLFYAQIFLCDDVIVEQNRVAIHINIIYFLMYSTVYIDFIVLYLF